MNAIDFIIQLMLLAQEIIFFKQIKKFMENFSSFNPKNEKNGTQRELQIQPHHIPFEPNDSQASDTSYESSLSSNQQNNIGNAEYFRQQMSRFFINYPQLLNQQLIGSKTNQKSLWGDIASDIMTEAKQQPISLQGIAKRIAFYRQKAEEIDIIDLIVKEKDAILKQLDQQARMSRQESSNQKLLKPEQTNDKKSKTAGEDNQNIYYSWKKRHEISLKSGQKGREQPKSQSLFVQNQVVKQQNQNRKPLSLNKGKEGKKSAHQSKQKPFLVLQKNRIKTNSKLSLDKKQEKSIFQAPQAKTVFNTTSNLKNILKFEPKTQIAKQLLDEIKKHEDLNDEVAIKKIIVNFLVRHRDTMKKNILSKSNLNERLSKLHIEDSKQLLLFCPLKRNSMQSDLPLNSQTNTFLQILNQISTGHLMKYWKLLQQRKL